MGATVGDISRLLEALYPPYIAEEWDNVGLQIGSMAAPAEKVMIALEADREIVDAAVSQSVDLIITHHPFFFKPVKAIRFDLPQGDLIKDVIRHHINIYSAHTNLDAGDNGLNQFLAEKLELEQIRLLEASYWEPLYKLVVYVPEAYEAAVRQSLTGAGAGHIGKYSDCTFRMSGTGTFRPQEGCRPFIGQAGRLEEVGEYRLETVVPKHLLGRTLEAMKKSHPYEEVAYDLYPLDNKNLSYSPGRTGILPEPATLARFCELVKETFSLERLRVVGDEQGIIRKIALVSGAGASYIGAACRQGCDLLLTGDLKYHEAKDAQSLGLKVVDAGHQQMEQLMAPLLAEQLRADCRRKGYEVEILIQHSRECIRIV